MIPAIHILRAFQFDGLINYNELVGPIALIIASGLGNLNEVRHLTEEGVDMNNETTSNVRIALFK